MKSGLLIKVFRDWQTHPHCKRDFTGNLSRILKKISSGNTCPSLIRLRLLSYMRVVDMLKTKLPIEINWFYANK